MPSKLVSSKDLLVFCILLLLTHLFSPVSFATNNEGRSTSQNQPLPPLTVAVASNFRYTLERLIASSDYWSTQDIRLVSGSSGTLYAQITKGAPFDVFLSADVERPKALVASGYGETTHVYALGRLVIWPVQKGSEEYADKKALRAYMNGVKGKLAIANPELAPFGKAAMQVFGLFSEAHSQSISHSHIVRANLVKGANVTQTFQFVDSGNAQLGFVSESLMVQAQSLLGDEKYTHYSRISSELYHPIEQALLALKTSTSHPLSQALVDYLLSEAVQIQLPEFGYDIP